MCNPKASALLWRHWYEVGCHRLALLCPMVRVNSGGPNKDTGINFHRPIITVNGDVFLPCALWTSLNNSSMVSCSLNWICLNHRLDSRCFYIYIYMCVLYDISTWLVVEPPLWKIWLRQLGWLFPTEWKVIKFHGSKQPTSYTFFLILPNSRFLFTIASMHRTAQPVS